MFAGMQIRTVTADDLAQVRDIDGIVESSRYLHLERTGEGLAVSWKLEERPVRQKLIDPNRLDDDAYFLLKQIVNGIEDGLALTVELEDAPVAILVARPDPAANALQIIDLRVDYDFRRQGMGTALLFQAIARARELEHRAVAVRTLTNNLPAAALLSRCGFELSGIDTRLKSNHDLVKEAVTLFWYVPLD
jgi:GNAT superfamily N-acetyltransferase